MTHVTKDAVIAAREEYLVKNATEIHINKAQIPSLKSRIQITPAEVATPFPPLNLK